MNQKKKKNKIGRPRMGKSLRVLVSASVDAKTALIIEKIRKSLPKDKRRPGHAIDLIANYYSNRNS
mgnify:CR=1 FL=1